MLQIIDAHSHYMPPAVAEKTAFFKAHWSDIDGQLRAMDEHGIEQALLLYPTSDAHQNMGGQEKVCVAYNTAISAVVKRYPKRFVGAGIVPMDSAAALTKALGDFSDYGFRAISLASSYDGVYLDDAKFRPVFAYAKDNGLPIFVHAQIMNPIGEERVRDPLLSPVLEYVFDVSMCIGKLMMNGILAEFSDVNLVFLHYGGVLPFVKERFDTTYAMLRGRNFVKDLGKAPSEFFKNLYIDTSGSQSAAALACALELTDASHILWGSDYPSNRAVAGALDAVSRANLDEEQKHLIRFGNSARLLGA